MPAYQLRSATKDDSSAIRALIRSARINPLGLDWQRFLVAVDSEDRLIGCGQVKYHHGRGGKTSLELASIVVNPSWRGQGVARTIIEKLLANNPPPIYLTCRAGLEPFYQKFGFQVVRGSDLPSYFMRVKQIMKVLQRIGFVHEDLLVMFYNE